MLVGWLVELVGAMAPFETKRLSQLRLTLAGLIGRKDLGPPLWPALPGWGGMTVFDRSWYGRVPVERVEGFASEKQWRRAYREIVAFERSLAEEGAIVVKFWLHIFAKEQLKRFEARAKMRLGGQEPPPPP